MKRLTTFIAALALIATACGENDVELPETTECDYQATSIPFEQAANGATPEELLATAELEDEEVTAAGPEGDALISMTIQRRGDAATLQTSSECEDLLELPITFSFRTINDDTFDEQIELMLLENQGTLSVDQGINAEQLNGSFTPELGDDETLLQLSLHVTIDPEGDGDARLDAVTERTADDGSLSEEPQTLWTWSW